ncbi:hypothetical protein Tco_0458064 [Tanacetum coccineum]
MDARLDTLSVDFDEELYPHMLTAIAGRRQVFANVVSTGIAKGMSEGLKYGVEHGKAGLKLIVMEAFDPEADNKYVRNPRNPWACKDEILLEDAIAANISRAEKKKKSRVVCRTHVVGSAHHARSDGISVSVPTVAPQGLQILLADAASVRRRGISTTS